MLYKSIALPIELRRHRTTGDYTDTTDLGQRTQQAIHRPASIAPNGLLRQMESEWKEALFGQ